MFNEFGLTNVLILVPAESLDSEILNTFPAGFGMEECLFQTIQARSSDLSLYCYIDNDLLIQGSWK